MNILYNISDFCLNISYAEGFGLSTLESMQAGRPIVAVKTGGLTRQVVDHRDGSENGVAIDIDCRSLVGSQSVPYIFEDYATPESIADALFKFYKIPKNEKDELSKKVRNYVSSEFDYKDVVSEWHESLLNVSRTWKDTYKRWETYTI
jgi:glycosyltransferase involved in cell wall biosynthesis